MRLAALVELAVCWLVWIYPFVFVAPHGQRRGSIARPLPARIGLGLETLAIVLAFTFRASPPPGLARTIAAMIVLPLAPPVAWAAVVHLGRQFRIHAGLYEDHELISGGPYSVVRHPIYASLFGMLIGSLLVLTAWPWTAICIAIYITGTEIRVHTEDALLAGRFGASFTAYRQRVRAYIPYLR